MKEAGIEGAGQGVWAEKFFCKGVRFGPYGGEIVNENVGKESGYAWEVSVFVFVFVFKLGNFQPCTMISDDIVPI